MHYYFAGAGRRRLFVKLEAFRRDNSRQLSVIFEKIGYTTKDGIEIDIDGQKVWITKTENGFYFDASEQLKEQWNLFPGVYEYY